MTVTEQKGVTNNNWKCGAQPEVDLAVHFGDVFNQLSSAVFNGQIFKNIGARFIKKIII